MKTQVTFALLLVLALSSCEREEKETTTRGNLHALFAESVAPAMVEEVNQFLSNYEKNGAKITYDVVSSDQAIRRMIRDTVRYIVTTCPLNAGERQQLPAIKGFDLNEILIAYDGIAVAVNPKNAAEQMTTVELAKILSGGISRWEQLSHAESMKGKIELFYQDSSDISSFVDARLLHGQAVRRDFHPTHSSLQTLQSIASQPSSIGLVGVLWVDSSHVSPKILKIGETKQQADTTFRLAPEAIGKFYSPHPANVYRNFYPLKRAIYSYMYAPLGSLASGFGAFVANSEGQRFFLQKGIVPATQKIRLKGSE